MTKPAAADPGGTITFEHFGGGSVLQTSDHVFNEDSSRRTIALWESVLEELEGQGFVKATSERREVFEVTRRGFAAADALKT